jgi:hypothetical protein
MSKNSLTFENCFRKKDNGTISAAQAWVAVQWIGISRKTGFWLHRHIEKKFPGIVDQTIPGVFANIEVK